MTTRDERAVRDQLEQQRREADARYNEALTALDRAVVAAAKSPSVGRDDLARLHTALIVFLQQITAFVESKDREVAGDAAARMAQLERALEPVAELRTQVGVLQRAVRVLGRSDRASANIEPVPAHAHPPVPESGRTDYQYVGFEDEFRGSDAAIEARLSAYVPIFAGAAGPVLDLGCGRGEMLAALTAAGVRAKGVDVNGAMIAIARDRGLDAVEGDALLALQATADDSLGGIVATQVVEHLEPSYLLRLLDTAGRKLAPGAPIVIETINAACWLAFFSSYIRDLTHVRPIHPDTLQYLLRANGFERVRLQYSAPVPDHMKMMMVDVPPSLREADDPASAALRSIAHAVSANALILNNLLFTHMDYAAIAYRA
jgi:O-antigen chain-terminating methyltransferase